MAEKAQINGMKAEISVNKQTLHKPHAIAGNSDFFIEPEALLPAKRGRRAAFKGSDIMVFPQLKHSNSETVTR